MALPDQITTTVSAKGQVVLPKPIRRALRWNKGTRLMVENTPDGVTLKRVPVFPRTRVEDVFGCVAYDGPPKSLEEMEAGIVAEVRRRHARR